MFSAAALNPVEEPAPEPWTCIHLYEVRENPGNTKIKDDTKQDHQPLAVCEDLAETNGTRILFVIEKLELKKKTTP